MVKNRGIKERMAKVGWVITIFAIAMLAGCMKMEMGGRPLKKKMIAKIEPGKTTKNEITQWFGMPCSISEPNQIGQGQVNIHPYWGGTLGSRNPFEFFTPKHKIADSYRVYYYYYLRSTMGPVVPFYSEMKQYKDELFVLIDESTQLVVDFTFVPDKH